VRPVVPVYHPRREARRAVKQGYPRRLGNVRLCRSGEGVERLLQRHLVDAVVLDVKAAPDLALALPVRFPRIPVFALSAFRPDDGALVRRCQAAGYAGVLVEGVDNAVVAEWIAARTAQAARRQALAAAPRLLRLTDRLQLDVWEEVLRRVAIPTKTGQLALALRVTREHLSRRGAESEARHRPGAHRLRGRSPGQPRLLGAWSGADPGVRLAQPLGGGGATGGGRGDPGAAHARAGRRAGSLYKRKDAVADVNLSPPGVARPRSM